MDNNMFGRPEENGYEGNSSMPETQSEQQPNQYTNADTENTSIERQEMNEERPEQAVQTEQYYSGNTSQYSAETQNAQNPYSYENISSQNSNSYDNLNNQTTYSSYDAQGSQTNQNMYSSYDAQSGQTNQNVYSSYDAQSGQTNQNVYSSYDAQSGQTNQNAYSSYDAQGSQTNQNIYTSSYDSQNGYSYNNANNASGQDGYSYNNSNTQGAYSYNGQNAYGNQNNTQNTYSYGYQNNQSAQDSQNQFSYGTQNNQGQTSYNNPYAASYGTGNNGYQGYQSEMEEPVKMGDWLLLQCLLSFIPCVGIILAIVWAFSKTEKQSKVNFCKAYLIVVLIRLAIALVLIVLYGSIFLAAWDAL